MKFMLWLESVVFLFGFLFHPVAIRVWSDLSEAIFSGLFRFSAHTPC
jgi:hypothetical protein